MKIKADPTGLDIEISDSDKEFASKISGHNLFGMLGDQIAKWRWQNALKILQKSNKLASDSKVSLKTIPSKFLQQFLEASSLEENESLQTMWANLLINKSQNESVNILYINILKSLEPFEAELIQMLYSQSKNSTDTVFDFNLILKAAQNMGSTQLKVIIHKLYGFNVLRPPLMQSLSAGHHSPALETVDIFRFSELGLDFCQKCNKVDK